MVIYIGAFLSMCTHFSLTQTVMAKFGWLVSATFKTTGVESASLIANIFLSPVRYFCSLTFIFGYHIRWSLFFNKSKMDFHLLSNSKVSSCVIHNRISLLKT